MLFGWARPDGGVSTVRPPPRRRLRRRSAWLRLLLMRCVPPRPSRPAAIPKALHEPAPVSRVPVPPWSTLDHDDRGGNLPIHAVEVRKQIWGEGRSRVGCDRSGGGRCLSRVVRKAAENPERDCDHHQEERSGVEERTGRSPDRRTGAELRSPAGRLRISRGAPHRKISTFHQPAISGICQPPACSSLRST